MTKEETMRRYDAEYLKSRTGETIAKLAKLKDGKYRAEYGLYLAEGIKLTEEALSVGGSGLKWEMVLVREDALEKERIPEALDKAATCGIPIKVTSPEAFEKVSTEKAPQGIIAVLRRTALSLTVKPEGRYLLLDNIQDPGNLGTVLRSAVAFGCDGLILCGCVDPTGPKTVRASMGALFRCPVMTVEHLPDTVQMLRENGHKVWAAALGENDMVLGEVPLSASDCVVIGNEGHGVGADTIAVCDGVMRIPMAPGAESLNASVAASVVLWEYYRSFR